MNQSNIDPHSSMAWLISNVKSDEFSELFDSELASSRMRAGVCVSGCIQSGLNVLPLNYRAKEHRPRLVFMGKYVHDSYSGQFLDDGGARWDFWHQKIKVLHDQGGKLVLDYTDNHFVNPNVVGDFYRLIKPYTSGLVVPSEKMKSNLEGNWEGPIHIIPEPVEISTQAVERPAKGERIAMWFGHASNLTYLFNFLRSELFNKNKPDRLVLLTNQTNPEVIKQGLQGAPSTVKYSLVKWSVPSMLQVAKSCDYSIVPSDAADDRKNGASPGRLLTSLMLGLPTVATSLESYKPFAEYFAGIENPACASELMSNPCGWWPKVKRAQDLIFREYSVDAIGRDWARVAKTFL